MRASLLIAALLGLAGLASSASAQCYYYAPPRAPDLFHPAMYNSPNPCIGAYQSVLPPFPPFQGMLLPGMPKAAGAGSPFGTHPFARSPRDFYMYDAEPRYSPYRYGPVSPVLPGQ